MYLAAVAYFHLRDYKNSFKCMEAAVQTCTDANSLEVCANSFFEMYSLDCKMLNGIKSDPSTASCLRNNKLLYEALDQTVALKRQELLSFKKKRIISQGCFAPGL